jgi:hypothetical protein
MLRPGLETRETRGTRLLVEKVVMSPFSPQWFEPVLKETMSRFAHVAPIDTSEVMLEPFF